MIILIATLLQSLKVMMISVLQWFKNLEIIGSNLILFVMMWSLALHHLWHRTVIKHNIPIDGSGRRRSVFIFDNFLWLCWIKYTWILFQWILINWTPIWSVLLIQFLILKFKHAFSHAFYSLQLTTADFRRTLSFNDRRQNSLISFCDLFFNIIVFCSVILWGWLRRFGLALPGLLNRRHRNVLVERRWIMNDMLK